MIYISVFCINGFTIFISDGYPRVFFLDCMVGVQLNWFSFLCVHDPLHYGVQLNWINFP